ncbi:glycerophosphodiester phosphodiesterase, partial [Chloroflexota bacterium]
MIPPTLPINDDHLATLDKTIHSEEDHALALRHAPRIRFDIQEPFYPSVVGYTVFREAGRSPSFPREIEIAPQVTTVIEYAVWWDWDIGHLYELEHIWVYLDDHENLVAGEASWHGEHNAMSDENGQWSIEDGRLVVYSEPGKHAFAPSPQWLLERAPRTIQGCGINAGKMGVHVTPLFKNLIADRTPPNNRLVHTYLGNNVFTPSYDFSNVFALESIPHVPWGSLFQWIPGRITWWLEQLDKHIPPSERRALRIAHRGASAYAQENSLSSISKAAELGADMVEIDVRITADNVPVIAHDDSLKRVFGIDKTVGQLPLNALRKATSDGHEPIMTFEEVTAVCKELQIGLYLDIKSISYEATESIFETLKRYSFMSATIIGSFRPDWLAEIKAHEPDATTSILFSSTHVDPVLLAKAVNCDYVHPCWERFEEPHKYMTETWMHEVRTAGLGIVCWHEERSSEIRALQRLGVDGICSDLPELLKAHTR